jgi:hypothetical protein
MIINDLLMRRAIQPAALYVSSFLAAERVHASRGRWRYLDGQRTLLIGASRGERRAITRT